MIPGSFHIGCIRYHGKIRKTERKTQHKTKAKEIVNEDLTFIGQTEIS